ncbi:MAG: AarF/UbiB family protein [Planctomycetia bacterium]|nr:AarF/UbiB family protein [Planctomycetia bacterium]
MSSTPPLFNTFRNIKRISEIVSVLLRYGLDDVVRFFGLESFYETGRKFFSKKYANSTPEDAFFSVRLRKALEELGPTFIKFGQIMSTRSDLFSPETLAELKRLQDHCEKIPFEKILKELEAGFPHSSDWKEIFESIDEIPLAAGSIAQTHRAVLKGGKPAVLKIMRPGIRSVIRSDIDVLTYLARHLESFHWNLGFHPVEMVNEFADQIFRELDFQNEAQSTDRLQKLFTDSPNVCFPKVYWEAVSGNILTLEEIKGTPLSQLDVSELTPEDRNQIAENLFHGVFMQCFEHGFFHADPHPGNLFVCPGNKIAFIDCGLTSFLDRRTGDLLAGLFYGMAADDSDRVVRAVIQLGDVDPEIAARREFYADIAAYVARFRSLPFEQIQVGSVLQDFFSKLRKYHVHCPSDILFLIKTISLLESDVVFVCPSFHFSTAAQPYLVRLIKQRWRPKTIRRALFQSADDLGRLISVLPSEIEQGLGLFKKGKIQIRLVHEGLEHMDQTVARSSWRIANMFFGCSLMLSGSIMILAEQFAKGASWLGEIGLAAFGISFLFLLGSNLPNWFFRNK